MESVCFPLLNAIYEKKALPKTDGAALLEEAGHFNISAQLYVLLKQHPLTDKLEKSLLAALKQNYEKTFFVNMMIKRQFEEMIDAFEAEKLDMIALKGIPFAEKYFGHFSARPTSDIDILVKEADIEKSILILQRLGYTEAERIIPGHFHTSFRRQLPGSSTPLRVEVHWDLLKKNTASLQMQPFWQNAGRKNGYKHIWELSAYHTFYLICLHGWRHNMDSLKYFLDIVQLIYVIGEKINYTELFEDASRDQTRKRLIRTLSIVYKQFPHLQTVKPFPYKKTASCWSFSPFLDKSRRSLKVYADFIDYQLFSFDHMKHIWNNARGS
ncbi:nucleotidyltransferase family protein [Bacillaceae bacterium Marseille-Q3522]|nr:nucleotidyltransferase family protein [Bacillaceae bacterium Marseille-Q3522]